MAEIKNENITKEEALKGEPPATAAADSTPPAPPVSTPASQVSAGSGDYQAVDKELVNILENEATNYDSDGVARGQSPGRPPSANSSVGSVGSKDSRGKRRTWKKPKDKPKRPLSAYNIFFKHERSRIVEGREEDGSAEEVIRSIENILSTSRETRRHRKTHGRISFGDLARKIAEKWKGIVPEHKAVFEHYAELDMRRYRKELKIWKDKKEAGETLDGAGSAHDSTSGGSVPSEFSIEQHIMGSQGGGGAGSDAAWAPRKNFYDQMNSSFSSSCSVDSELSMEPIPIGDMLMNARPNFHNSMPTLDTSIPGEIQGGFNSMSIMQSSAEMSNQMTFGNASLTNMHLPGGGGGTMNQMGGGPQPGMVTSGGGGGGPGDGSGASAQQIIQQQQELIRQQQEMLNRQRQSLQMQMQMQSQGGGGGGGFNNNGNGGANNMNFNNNNMSPQQQQQMMQQMQQMQQQQQMQQMMEMQRRGSGMRPDGAVSSMNPAGGSGAMNNVNAMMMNSGVSAVGNNSGGGGGGGTTELDGFLSNLDLSNV